MILEMTMATFGSWLSDQAKRDDLVGHLAIQWNEDKAAGIVSRINSPSGIQKWIDEMARERHMDYQAGYDAALHEYRQSRGEVPDLRPVPDGGFPATPGQDGGYPSPGQAVTHSRRPATSDDLAVRLDLIAMFLRRICDRLGIDREELTDLDTAPEPGMMTPRQRIIALGGTPEDAPAGYPGEGMWPWMAQAADYSEAEAE